MGASSRRTAGAFFGGRGTGTIAGARGDGDDGDMGLCSMKGVFASLRASDCRDGEEVANHPSLDGPGDNLLKSPALMG
jgi:hypothetical protein